MVEYVVTKTGWTPDYTRSVVKHITEHLATEFAGSRIYIPKASAVTEEEIREAFYMRSDVEGTCQRFGISRRTLYRILGKAA